jgi:surface antigen
MPRPISQVGFEQPQTPRPISQTGIFTGGEALSRPISQAGFEQAQTPRPISQAGIESAPLTPAESTGWPGNISDLADMDTAHQPAAQVGEEGRQAFQPAPAEQANEPGSISNSQQALQPLSQSGLGNEVIQPVSHSGLAQAGQMGYTSTRALLLSSQPGFTQALEKLPKQDPRTTASRPPMVIRGNQQGQARSIRPPQGRRHVISIAAFTLLLLITGGMLLAVSPLGLSVKATLGIPSGNAHVIQNSSGKMNLVAQATATAVVHQQKDGYVPGTNSTGAILTGSPETWPLGVCTYWANLRYHELTGHWVKWLGNAYQWADGARLAGWHVSTQPHVPSIIVLMPGVEGASGFGHVAVVESASGNSAYTSDMNWYVNGGGWDIKSYYTFTAGPGVYFIWD